MIDNGLLLDAAVHSQFVLAAGGGARECFQRPLVEAHTRRALAAISPIVDSSERDDSQNIDRNLEWLGLANRFALGWWIGTVSWDSRRSRVPWLHLVPVPWA